MNGEALKLQMLPFLNCKRLHHEVWGRGSLVQNAIKSLNAASRLFTYIIKVAAAYQMTFSCLHMGRVGLGA